MWQETLIHLMYYSMQSSNNFQKLNAIIVSFYCWGNWKSARIRNCACSKSHRILILYPPWATALNQWLTATSFIIRLTYLANLLWVPTRVNKTKLHTLVDWLPGRAYVLGRWSNWDHICNHARANTGIQSLWFLFWLFFLWGHMDVTNVLWNLVSLSFAMWNSFRHSENFLSACV